MKTFRVLASAAALLATSLVPAHSAVMTFADVLPARNTEGLPTPPNYAAEHIWIEDGITAYARELDGHDSWIHSHVVPGAVHMTDPSYSWPDTITFTMEHLFDAVSFDILPTDNWLWHIDDADFDNDVCGNSLDCGTPFNNVRVTGMRDGSIIAEDSFYMGMEPWTYLFSSAFLDLDTLVIAMLMPDHDLLHGAWGEECGGPCTNMDIRNITLSPVSPVPLPAPLLLFLTGLGAMALLGRVGKGGAKRQPPF